MSSSPQSPTEHDLTGRQIGAYTLLRRLGSGGMADVYLASEQSLIQRHVALKVLKPELAKDQSYVKRFHREAQSAATLVQANIVQIYEVNHVDGLHFIAQEYVQGRNLRQYLERHGAVEAVMALTVLRQCALALQKAASHNIVHRDIKPENIMLSTSGEVKVTDFGLARANNDSNQQALTQIGITMGTPLYMSPEQVEGRSLDTRSDIYSLGVTTYHMLAGKPPFEGENALAIAVQQVNETAIPLSQVRPDVPVELCDLVHRMISKEPAQRPQSAAQLLKELRKIKIDVDEDWDRLVEKLSETDGLPGNINANATTRAKLEATQQLQAIMHGNIRSWWKSPTTIAAMIVLSLLAVGGGWILAQTNPPASLLDVGTTAVAGIPRQDTVEDQYITAYWKTLVLPSDAVDEQIEQWQAVIEHFPLEEDADNLNERRLFHRRAQERMGEIFLTHNRLKAALAIYERLESQEDVASEYFRVTGVAGKAVVYYRMPEIEFAGGEAERQEKIRSALAQIGPKLNLLAPFLRDKIETLRSEVAALQASEMEADS